MAPVFGVPEPAEAGKAPAALLPEVSWWELV